MSGPTEPSGQRPLNRMEFIDPPNFAATYNAWRQNYQKRREEIEQLLADLTHYDTVGSWYSSEKEENNTE